MKIMLVNAVHTAIGSRIPDEQLPPLGLLAVGGPLIDAGHEVKLVDADRVAMSSYAIRFICDTPKNFYRRTRSIVSITQIYLDTKSDLVLIVLYLFFY